MTEHTTPTIKLLVATGLYPPDIGGPATYARMLEDDLPSHGFAISIVTFTAVRHLPKVFRHLVFFFNVVRASKGQDIIYALTLSVLASLRVSPLLLHESHLSSVLGATMHGSRGSSALR
jgi:hypothetical protein